MNLTNLFQKKLWLQFHLTQVKLSNFAGNTILIGQRNIFR
ncbi:hypothetical protein SAMN05444003_1191 [Cognatiyoonia sediminum]|uniref:Uncharacterized protein n=1 Tax=Cognatiyoonia sediminum TaxID=1508389 RepID=A0A1M5N4X7_9RHOB|nr:hypothetical protein SAMN05444003_1191 [Cognatiyoonia sediminum]